MLRGFMRHFPKAEGRVDYIDVATPLTNLYYLGRSDSYGLEHTPARYGGALDKMRPETAIPSLFCTGQVGRSLARSLGGPIWAPGASWAGRVVGAENEAAVRGRRRVRYGQGGWVANALQPSEGAGQSAVCVGVVGHAALQLTHPCPPSDVWPSRIPAHSGYRLCRDRWGSQQRDSHGARGHGLFLPRPCCLEEEPDPGHHVDGRRREEAALSQGGFRGHGCAGVA